MKFPVLLAFGASGAAALIYEVAWTRAVGLVLGSTTYALSTMLSAFMAGLALGGYLGGILADRSTKPVLYFGILEFGIGVFGLATLPLMHWLTPYYFSLYRHLHLSPPSYMAVQFLVCFVIMLVPTVLMGLTFPLVSRIMTDSRSSLGKGVGIAYSSNTFGAILGSLSAGFLLIPALGLSSAVMIAAGLNVFAGTAMALASRQSRPGRLAILALPFLAASLFLNINDREEEWFINYYNAYRFSNPSEYAMSVADYTRLFGRDFTEGRVNLWRDQAGFLMLQVGGKIEGTGFKDLTNARLLAYLPLASHPNPRTFFTIGLGAGATLAAAKEHLQDVSLVEVNPGVVEALAHYGPPGLLQGVDITINDARNHLALTDRKFDIISSEPSYPTDPGTGNLFTREFYSLALSRLNPGGIFCQWLPYYILSDDDVTTMLKTFGSVFTNVYLWKVPDSLDLLLVGSREPFRYGAGEIAKRVSKLNTHEETVNFVLSRDPDQVRQIVAAQDGLPMNTDDRPVIEFHAAMNFITGK